MTPRIVAAVLRESGWAPHRLAKDAAGRIWEYSSYPWPADKLVLINVRVPGDPTTMRALDAHSVLPVDGTCPCAEREGEDR